MRHALLLALALSFASPAWAQTAAAEDDETPAADAPVVVPMGTQKPRAAAAPAAGAGTDLRAMRAAIEKQGKEIAALKTENTHLRDQIKLLYSIVNKLAGLDAGK